MPLPPPKAKAMRNTATIYSQPWANTISRQDTMDSSAHMFMVRVRPSLSEREGASRRPRELATPVHMTAARAALSERPRDTPIVVI